MFAILDKTLSSFVLNLDGDTMLFDTNKDADSYALKNCDEYIILEVM